MDIDGWLNILSDGCVAVNKAPLSHSERTFLKSDKDQKTFLPNEKQTVVRTTGSFIRYMFILATADMALGPIHRIKERYGATLEENYGVRSGLFLQFARVYWTLKIEFQDLLPEWSDSVVVRMLNTIEIDLAAAFFPTRGVINIPKSLRKKQQRQILETYAPDINVKEFIRSNPLL